MQTCEDLSFLKTSSLLCSFLLMHPGWMVCRPLATSGCLRRLIVLKHFKPTWGRSVLSTFALKPEGSLFQDVSEDLPPTLKWFCWCSRFPEFKTRSWQQSVIKASDLSVFVLHVVCWSPTDRLLASSVWWKTTNVSLWTRKRNLSAVPEHISTFSKAVSVFLLIRGAGRSNTSAQTEMIKEIFCV